MIKFIITILFAGFFLASAAQDVPRFAKYAIAASGCHCYFPADPGSFDIQKSDDGLNMYVGEVNSGGAYYSIILVDLGDTYANAGKTELESLMTSYLDFLKGQLSITEAAGYGLGHTMESNVDAAGVIDFWEDADGTDYDVKAWCDSHFLAVLMVYSKEEINYNYKSLFLNGFRFPG